MTHRLILFCLIFPMISGCATNHASDLQGQCSAGDQAACEELARTSYEEQTDSSLYRSRPVIPSPASAAPSGSHLP